MKPAALLLIDSISRTRVELRSTPAELDRLERVQRWQVARLRRTYADYQADAAYADALDFFVSDLYGPHDFRQRDTDLQKVIHGWYRVLPERALEAITGALELEALSQALDMAVAAVIADETITEASYADAYRKANRKSDRQRQIWLIVRVGESLMELVDRPWVQTGLRLARRPARLAGVTALHSFLERGCAAFSKMTDADALFKAIRARETGIMKKLFAGTAQPFDVDSRVSARRKA